jgi:phage pi2 protein 07
MVLADFSNIDVEKLVDAWEEEDLFCRKTTGNGITLKIGASRRQTYSRYLQVRRAKNVFVNPNYHKTLFNITQLFYYCTAFHIQSWVFNNDQYVCFLICKFYETLSL